MMEIVQHYWDPMVGGLLIGLAAALLILVNGRIAGISGIVAGLLQPVKAEWQWRAVFIVGLMIAPLVYPLFGNLPEISIAVSHLQLAVAGLMVGLGARYGSGCTSGHGICGVARLSPRSIVATVTFMSAGMVMVYLMRQWIG
jgi:uncharacterized protein